VRILLIEDSARLAQTTTAALRGHGHDVSVAPSLRAAREVFEREAFELAIVDIGLPDGSGLAWCREARESGRDLPLLILTARSDVRDRIEGLDAGADDYLCKPFAVDELLARVRALGRRGPRWTCAVKRWGGVEIHRDRRTVSVEGATVPLTPREFDIVAVLAWREGRVVARDELLESVWGDSDERIGNSFDVLLARIRRKLEGRGVRDAIRTVRQVGYAWALEDSKRA